MATSLALGLCLAGLAQAQPQRRELVKRSKAGTIAGSTVIALLFVGIIVVTIVTWFGHLAHKKQKWKQGTHPDQLRVLRRQWYQGRSADRERQRAEGLNEDGFAPPPYLPKTSLEQQSLRGDAHDAGIAIPMQTFSREQPAMPPSYAGNSASNGLTRGERQQRIDEVNTPATKIPRVEEQELH